MFYSRRSFLHRLTSGLLVSALGLLQPLAAAAAKWNRAAFEAGKVEAAIAAVGASDASPSDNIVIKAPEIAENGAQVPIEITSNIPGTEAILIFSDKNVQPYVGTFEFKNGAEPFIATRIKMGDTSNLRAYVRANGKYYVKVREVKVTIGGCGA
ncbi:MAG TPA: thiosulfate oxidation carrier protein SoxY [Burkholderiales bacterium]|nr:thiosulfate oxidation carrier protein SoxY [Burkholderiales bacterium]